MDARAGFDAVIVAGGAGRRMAGADKPALVVDGVSLLDRAVGAVSAASSVTVVGPRRETVVPVGWRREQPVGGGPVAAIAAGLPVGTAPAVVTLAADLPWIAPAVPELLAALRGDDVAVLVDPSGRRNYLAAAWSRAALERALARLDPVGAPVRSLFAGVGVVTVPDRGGWGRDCDTPADLAAARRGSPRR